MDPIKVLAARRRRAILRLVWDDELPAGSIAAEFDVSWPAISQHLAVLKDAGYVTERRDGQRRLYRADRDAIGALAAVLEEMWREDLGRLKDLAERAQADTDGRPGPERAARTDQEQE